MSTAQEITRKAKSNLAFALKILPAKRRQDMMVFYAFCRTIDDLADADALPMDERANALQAWAHGLIHGFKDPSPLQRQVVLLIEHRELRVDLFLDIIEGCVFDLYINRVPTWEDLETYIWKVACTVGIISTKLFGCHAPESQNYAIELGKALQITNIMRDVHEDLRDRNRIYLPTQDLLQFGYSEEDLRNHVYNDRFVEMMEFHAVRAENHFEEANLNITQADRHALRPALIMSDIYRDLLRQMRKDRYRVFDKRYRVPRRRKLLALLKHVFS